MQCELSMPEPNTNLLFDRTVLPLATLHLEPGKYTVIYACLGDPKHETPLALKDVTLSGSLLTFRLNDQPFEVLLKEL